MHLSRFAICSINSTFAREIIGVYATNITNKMYMNTTVTTLARYHAINITITPSAGRSAGSLILLKSPYAKFRYTICSKNTTVKTLANNALSSCFEIFKEAYNPIIIIGILKGTEKNNTAFQEEEYRCAKFILNVKIELYIINAGISLNNHKIINTPKETPKKNSEQLFNFSLLNNK